MDASPISIDTLFEKKFFVPLYQRPYEWSPKDAGQLVQDVYDSYKAEDPEYFIGSVICIQRKGKERLEIIDGQQRLITLTLILLQLAAMIGDEGEQQALKNKVFRMVPPQKGSGKRVPKVSIEVSESEIAFYRDRIALQQAMPPAHQLDHKKKVFAKNYRRIGQKLRKLKKDEKLSNDDLIGIARYFQYKVRVVFILAGESVSALRLFNVLNSRGKSLEVVHLIKSEILHRVDETQVEEVREKWDRLGELVETENLENLNFFFELHQISEQPNRDQAAAAPSRRFDYYVRKLDEAKEDGKDSLYVLDKILTSAENYRQILTDDKDLAAPKTRFFLKSLSRDKEWLPAFMAFLNAGHFNEKQFASFAQLFEKVYMHGFFKSKAKVKQNAACYHAVEAINTNRPFEAIMRYIVMGDEEADNPVLLADNAGFQSSLVKDNFYGAANAYLNKLTRLVLLRVDRELNQKGGSVVPYLKEISKEITVEHVLPQDMSNAYWQDRFTHEQHVEWLHKLGNLTILPQKINAEAQNYGFDDKQKVYQDEDAGQENPFVMTQRLCKLKQWNVDQIKKRHKKLTGQIFSLWQIADDEYPADNNLL